MANCERDDIQTVCHVIFPLVSLMTDQVSSLREKESRLLLWDQTVQKMKTRKPQRANATLCWQPPKLCLEAIGPRFSHIEEQNRSCIHWWSALCGEIVFYPFYLYIVRKLSVIYYSVFVQLLFFCQSKVPFCCLPQLSRWYFTPMCV